MKHITSAERNSWNSKAEGSHSHSATEITSGTLPLTRGGTGGTTAATARTNLGLTGDSNTTHYHDGRYVQTRVYGGKLQYYDGEWKDVGGTLYKQPKRAFLAYNNTENSPGDTYRVVLNVTGSKGKLINMKAIADTGSSAGFIIKTTIDGVATEIKPSNNNNFTDGSSSSGSWFPFHVDLEFESSCKVEFRVPYIKYGNYYAESGRCEVHYSLA